MAFPGEAANDSFSAKKTVSAMVGKSPTFVAGLGGTVLPN